jgi:hypothetical protein
MLLGVTCRFQAVSTSAKYRVNEVFAANHWNQERLVPEVTLKLHHSAAITHAESFQSLIC